MSLIQKINGIPLGQINYMIMTDGVMHNVKPGTLQECRNSPDGSAQLVFVTPHGKWVTVRYDNIRDVNR